MKKALVYILVLMLCYTQISSVSAATSSTKIKTLRTSIENLRHDILRGTHTLERFNKRLTSTIDEVTANVALRSDQIASWVQKEHEMALNDIEISKLEFEMAFEKYERELDYIVDYASEADRDVKEDIKDEFEADIDDIEAEYGNEIDILELDNDELEESIRSISPTSLNYALEQELDRHTGKITSINGNTDEEDVQLDLLNKDLVALNEALQVYKTERDEYEDNQGIDFKDDQASVKESIFDEINVLGDDRSDIKNDLSTYLEDQQDEIQSQIDDRTGELEDITDEIFDGSPTSQTRALREGFKKDISSEITALNKMKTERSEWYTEWVSDVDAYYEEMIDELNEEITQDYNEADDKYSEFNQDVNALDNDVDAFLTELEQGAAGQKFTDVPASHDFHEAVNYLSMHNITQGRTANRFEPDDNVTREEFVTFLMRALYKEEEITAFAGTLTGEVTDVPANSSLAKYVKAAYVKGITQGRTASVFGFGSDIRRDEAVVMLLRAYAVDFSSIDTATGFTDTVELGEDFQKAISKAVTLGIINEQNGKFRPGGSITRGEAAKIIWKMATR